MYGHTVIYLEIQNWHNKFGNEILTMSSDAITLKKKSIKLQREQKVLLPQVGQFPPPTQP